MKDKQKPKSYPSNAELIEKIDYYFQEDGLMVFTALYHLKRGTCCGSKCKHCPYKHVNVQGSI